MDTPGNTFVCQILSRYGEPRRVVRRHDGAFEVSGPASYTRIGTDRGRVDLFDFDGGPLLEVGQPPFWNPHGPRIIGRLQPLHHGGNGPDAAPARVVVWLDEWSASADTTREQDAQTASASAAEDDDDPDEHDPHADAPLAGSPDGPSSPPPPVIDRFTGPYRFLSNFFPSPVRDAAGNLYPTVEHAYQAAKAATEEDRLRIGSAPSPKKAKRRAGTLQLGPDWFSRRLEVMRLLLVQKFAPGTELAALLLATGTAELVEGNDWGDRFWGRCQGAGENHIGRLLMEIRHDLRASADRPS